MNALYIFWQLKKIVFLSSQGRIPYHAIAECTVRVLRRRQMEEINNIPVRGLINKKPEVHVIQEEYSM